MSPPCDSSPWLAATVRVLLTRVEMLEKSLNEEFLMSQVVAALGSKQAQSQADVLSCLVRLRRSSSQCPTLSLPAEKDFFRIVDSAKNSFPDNEEDRNEYFEQLGESMRTNCKLSSSVSFSEDVVCHDTRASSAAPVSSSSPSSLSLMLLGAEDKKRIKRIKRIIKEIYDEHNPSKLEDVDKLMCKY